MARVIAYRIVRDANMRSRLSQYRFGPNESDRLPGCALTSLNVDLWAVSSPWDEVLHEKKRRWGCATRRSGNSRIIGIYWFPVFR